MILGKKEIKRFRRYRGYDYSRGVALFITIVTSPRRRLFGQIVNAKLVKTQRVEKFVREAVTEWAGQNVLLASDEVGYFTLAPNALQKMTGKSVYWRQTDAEIEANRHKLESFLRSEGTIWND